MAMHKYSSKLMVTVDKASYPIYIENNLLENNASLQEMIVGTQILIVTNETVAKFYLDNLKTFLVEFSVDVFIIEDGEQYKSLDSFKNIMELLIAKQHHRDTTLIALGGGVIGDLTGFVAACYQRGVNYIQIPTSLLSQVDSSVGGKTAVNHHAAKNMIGAFYHPQAVFIGLNTLQTLPAREFKSGLAEVIKYGLLMDEDFFAWLENNFKKILELDTELLSYMINHSLKLKANIVEQDEREQGVRALLNLGHTFGHAIEALTEYELYLHGEAVAIGIYIAAILSADLGFITQEELSRIYNLLRAVGLDVLLPKNLNKENILEKMQLDKKVKNNKLRVILLKKIGDAFLTDEVSRKCLLKAIDKSYYLP